MGFPKKEILMAYINMLCDLPKMKMDRLMAYINRSCDFFGRWDFQKRKF